MFNGKNLKECFKNFNIKEALASGGYSEATRLSRRSFAVGEEHQRYARKCLKNFDIKEPNCFRQWFYR